MDFVVIYPTLCELAGIEVPGHVEDPSAVPLLHDPDATWSPPAVSTHGRGNPAVRTESHRYIRCADGGEELYDHAAAPYEWGNLAKDPGSAAVLDRLRAHLPGKEAVSPGAKRDTKK